MIVKGRFVLREFLNGLLLFKVFSFVNFFIFFFIKFVNLYRSFFCLVVEIFGYLLLVNVLWVVIIVLFILGVFVFVML